MRAEARSVDVALLRRIAGRDKAAFEAIYDRFSAALYSLVLRIVTSPAEAEDVVQEGFVVIWTRAAEFNPGLGSPFGWMAAIMRHRAIDALRRRSRYHARTLEAIDQRTDDFDYVPANRGAEMSDLRRAIQAACHQLSLSENQVIALAFFDGLTHQEIADKLGSPVGTVKARIRRGMLKLRAVLVARGPAS